MTFKGAIVKTGDRPAYQPDTHGQTVLHDLVDGSTHPSNVVPTPISGQALRPPSTKGAASGPPGRRNAVRVTAGGRRLNAHGAGSQCAAVVAPAAMGDAAGRSGAGDPPVDGRPSVRRASLRAARTTVSALPPDAARPSGEESGVATVPGSRTRRSLGEPWEFFIVLDSLAFNWRPTGLDPAELTAQGSRRQVCAAPPPDGDTETERTGPKRVRVGLGVRGRSSPALTPSQAEKRLHFTGGVLPFQAGSRVAPAVHRAPPGNRRLPRAHHRHPRRKAGHASARALRADAPRTNGGSTSGRPDQWRARRPVTEFRAAVSGTFTPNCVVPPQRRRRNGSSSRAPHRGPGSVGAASASRSRTGGQWRRP